MRGDTEAHATSVQLFGVASVFAAEAFYWCLVAALALLTDAVKKGGAMATSSVGGLSGAFIPVSEDIGMIEAAGMGALIPPVGGGGGG